MSAVIKTLKCCIRKMELQDIQQVIEIDKLSFTLPWPERSFAFEVTGNPASRPWIAEIAEAEGKVEVAGMVVIWLIFDEAHIGTLAVHPKYRGGGIAQRLLAESLLHAYAEGVQRCFLEVRRSNLAAQALYNRFGFLVTTIRARYYKDNSEDAFLMTLENLNQENLLELVGSDYSPEIREDRVG